MNPRKLPRAALVDFARTTINAVAGGKITGLSPEQALAFAAELEAATDTLWLANNEQMNRRAAYLEGNEVARESEAAVIRILANLKAMMAGVEASDDQYDAAGFDPPAPHLPVAPQTPTGLAVRRRQDGAVILVYNGNNTPGRVIYCIEAAIDGEYRQVGMTTRQRFKLEDTIPGRPVRYRVFAQSARLGRSNYSNETVA